MRSFLTGSRAYGTPRVDSDIDLVVLVSQDDANVLWHNNGDSSLPASQNFDAPTLRFGDLNLIAIIDDEDGRKQFEIWRDVTEALKQRAPVTKEEAIKAFDEAGRTFTNIHLSY